MKQEKTCAIIYLITAVCFYISAILGFVDKNGMGAMWTWLGSINLCVSGIWFYRFKKNWDKNKKEDKK